MEYEVSSTGELRSAAALALWLPSHSASVAELGELMGALERRLASAACRYPLMRNPDGKVLARELRSEYLPLGLEGRAS